MTWLLLTIPLALVLLWAYCLCRAAGRADRAADEQGRAEAIKREMERAEMAVFYSDEDTGRWTA